MAKASKDHARSTKDQWFLWLLPAALLLPWLVWDPGSLYPYFEIKTVVWVLAALALCVLWFFHKGGEAGLCWLDGIWLAWMAWSALSLLWLPDPRIGLPDLVQRLAVALAYPLVRWLPSPAPNALARRFALATLIAAEIQNVTVTFQWIQSTAAGLSPWDNTRLVGTIGYHTFTAAFLVVCLPLAGVLWVDAGRRGRVVLGFVGVHGVGILVLLQSRAAWLALFGSLAGFLLFARPSRWVRMPSIRLRLWLAAGLVALAVLGGLTVAFSHHKAGGMWARTVEDLSGSHITGRRLIWMTAQDMLGEKPLLGLGLGGFYYGYIPHQTRVLKELPPERFLPVREMVIWAHDEFLQELVELGPLGLAGLLLLFGSAAWLGLRAGPRRPEAFFPALSLLAWSVTALFDFPLHRPAEAILFFGILGMTVRVAGGGEAGRKVPAKTVASVLCALALLIAWGAGANYLSLTALNLALKAPADMTASKVEAMFNKSIRLAIRPGQPEAALGGYSCAHGRPQEGIPSMEKAITTFRDTVLYENLGKAYLETGDLSRAKDMYALAVGSGIRFAADTASLAKVELALGEKDQALSRLKGALQVFPKNPSLALSLAGFYYSEKAFERCLEILDASKVSVDPALPNLRAAALVRLGRASEALIVLRGITTAHPRYAPAWSNLGAVQQALGDRVSAKEAYGKALSIEPTNAVALAHSKELEMLASTDQPGK